MICLWIAATLLCAAQANPDGAPVVACETMAPQHGGALPQDPDTVITTLTAFDIGDGTINVTVTANDENVPFKGVFLQVRREGSTVPEGVFIDSCQCLKPRPCPLQAEVNGMTHVNADPKTRVTALWSPPEGATGTFKMMATIVEINSGDEIRHWVGQSLDINVA